MYLSTSRLKLNQHILYFDPSRNGSGLEFFDSIFPDATNVCYNINDYSRTAWKSVMTNERIYMYNAGTLLLLCVAKPRDRRQ